jgi:hypothetical protein
MHLNKILHRGILRHAWFCCHRLSLTGRPAGWLMLALLALSLSWLPAVAQSPTLTLSNANLRLSPEYDDPGLLVIMSGTFDNITSYPQKITLPVPAGARGIQTTEQDGDQLLVRQATGPEAGQISYELASKPAFQAEYYLDREPSGNDRAIKYSWRAPYAIKNLLVTIQQPARSTNFTVTPSTDAPFQSSDGLTAYQIKRQNVAAGDQLDFEIRYTKTDTAPSFPSNPASTNTNANTAASAASTANTTAPAATPSSSSTPILPLVLIGAGVAALAGAAIYWFMERRQTAAEPAARNTRSAPARSPRADRPSDDDVASYCPKCGRPFAAGDRFCGQCGTRRPA